MSGIDFEKIRRTLSGGNDPEDPGDVRRAIKELLEELERQEAEHKVLDADADGL